jgi:ammonia channel protein AmtB
MRQSVRRPLQESMKEKLIAQDDTIYPHNQNYIVFGTLLLWVAWLFFNAGAGSGLTQDEIA